MCFFAQKREFRFAGRKCLKQNGETSQNGLVKGKVPGYIIVKVNSRIFFVLFRTP